jgi:hypothetical protein
LEVVTIATPSWITLANSNQYNQTNTFTYASDNSLQDISPGQGKAGQAFQTQAAQLYPGQLMRFTGAGVYSTTSSPTLALALYYGGASATVAALGSTAAYSTPSGATNQGWYMQAMSRVLTVGSVGTIQTSGFVTGINGALGYGGSISTAANLVAPIPAAQTVSGVTVDTTAAKVITLAAIWGTSSPSNTITCLQWAVEYLTEP